YADVVLGISSELFEDALDEAKRDAGVRDDNELSADRLAQLADQFKAIVKRETGNPFPEEPIEQLRLATIAVFDSWNTRRARNYRAEHDIPDDLGTAVNVQ